ncbi:MAG: hypothetical protein JNJ63_10940 [Hyphomonadaceae bacterium]|nr:hypothetical protein [Hyphomonadaceae bacterium]
MHRAAAVRYPVGQRADRERAGAVAGTLAAAGYETILDRRGVHLLWRRDESEADPFILADDAGLVLGRLMRRGQSEPMQTGPGLDEAVSAWLKSSGASLLGEYWGAYLAFLADRERDRLLIVRDPSGARACYGCVRDGVRVFATHPADLLAGVSVDQVRLAGFLCHPRLSLRRTGIAGLEEIAPGEVWSSGREEEGRRQGWRPLGRISAHTPAEIGAQIKGAVEQAALALTSNRQRVLHRLSGGLDSSIVLSALAAARRMRGFELICVNEFSAEVPEGDERLLARASAQRLATELIEMAFTPAPFSYTSGLETWTPAPGFALLNSGALAFIAAMGAHKGALLTSGQGGDHLFQRDRTLHLGADALRRGALNFDLALALARMSGVSVWKLAANAWRYGRTGAAFPASAYASPSALSNRDLALQAIGEHFAHPWLADCNGAPPGEVLRALHILEATHYFASSVLDQAFTPAPVLVSQPVMEACLAAPTYVMAPGVERGLVREAYANDLPAEVLGRTSKGETTRFFVAQLERQWPALRELLLGGLLVEQEALAAAHLEAMLAANRVPDLSASADLMTCVAAELWLRSLPLQRA